MPDTRVEYRLAPETERDLEAIWLYTFEEWGLEQANQYIDELTDAFTNLAENPMYGTACYHIRKGYRRAKSGRHIIYYCAADYGIAVIRVLHDRMLSTRHL